MTVTPWSSPPTHGWRYDRVSFKAAHNAYDRGLDPFTELLRFNPKRPQDKGVRGLELDLNQSSVDPARWSVNHDTVYVPGTKHDLSTYLTQLYKWSDSNKGHDVITVTLDLKTVSDESHFLEKFDSLLRLYFDADQICRPFDLIQSDDSLAWPKLGNLTGKFVFCLSGGHLASPHIKDLKKKYAASDPDRICFADRAVSWKQKCPEDDADKRIFFNVHLYEWFAQQDGNRFREDLSKLTKCAPFITRVFEVKRAVPVKGLLATIMKKKRLWRYAIGQGAHIIASDLGRKDNFAVNGQEGLPFRLRSTSSVAD